MNEIVAYFTEISAKLPYYPRYIHFVVIALVIAFTQAIKVPLRKYVIDVKITNTSVRKKVNLVFMVLPFGLGLGASGILTCFDFPFSWEAGLSWGVYAQVVYELIARILLKIKNNEEITTDSIAEDFEDARSEAEALKSKVEETTKDFDDFIKKIKGSE